MKKPRTEIDFVFTKVENELRKTKIMLPTEFDTLTSNCTPIEKRYIKSKLIAQGYSINEDMIEFSKKSRPEEEIEDNVLLDLLIRPDYVDTQQDTIQVGNLYYKGIVASGFPATVSENWLGQLAQEKRDIDFSIFIEPSSVHTIEVYLNKQLRKVENDLYKYEQKGVSNPSLKTRKEQLTQQLKQILSGQYKLFKFSLHIATKAQSEEEVSLLASKVVSNLHAQGIETKYTTKYNEQLLKSIIPTGRKHLSSREILVPGPAAAASFPFSSSFLDIDEQDGILLGFNSNDIPVAKSIWKLPKYVGTIIGSTGSGKSYATKALVLNDSLVHQSKVFILDPEDEYTAMCQNIVDAQVIRLSRKSNKIPNVLSLMGTSLSEKLSSVPRIFDVLLEGLSSFQKPLLERAVITAYQHQEITEDNPASWLRVPPTLLDIQTILEKDAKATKDYKRKEAYDEMISKLSRYTTGIFKFMNTTGENLNPNARFNVIEFKSMPEEVRPVLMMILLEFIKMKFLQDKEKKILVLDEAWRVLKNKAEAAYV